jgi:preprotein translocase subunit SecD
VPTGQKVSAIGVIVAALLGVIYTLAAGNQPLLGLDLQGGVSVVLEPTAPTDGAAGREVNDESLDLTVELLRARIDQIGVAEPEISRQGTNIVVGLPGLVSEQEDALARLRQTAELRFRPVLIELGIDNISLEDLEELESDGSDSPGQVTDSDTDSETDSEEESMVGGGRFSPLAPAQEDNSGEGAPVDVLDGIAGCFISGTTDDVDDAIDEVVVLDDDIGIRYCLGPAVLPSGDLLTGDMVETASVGLTPGAGWTVSPVFNGGANGIDRFNEIAELCFLADQTICPTGRLAVVLDHQVISAPSINAVRFDRDGIIISGGSASQFEEEEARRLAEALRFGALPLELVAQETRTVSATIGSDVLRSGVIAGLIGLALVAVYLLAYYRLAGLVAIGGLVLSAALLWTTVAWFGESFGLALSLAGVVGLIVSIGVSTDSNIVYFENVKDSYRSGRRVPTAIERAYESAISTIVKADVVSLIAAVLLYLLTVGAVRGFAFYLGLATILDLIISWLFMRPALSWLAGRQAVAANPTLIGLPADGGPQ